MAPFAPFEPAPRLAVAVSGGRDSMALALLAAEWSGARGGSVLALTVDHGLRPEAAAEAVAVGRRLARHGIAHRILARPGPAPASRLQERARALRYDLLVAACRDEGILHLLVAHQRDDQAETVAIRAARGSGADGRAGMAPLRETAGPRLLRPLLAIPRERLTRTLEARGEVWIDDPSNRDPRFQRTELRHCGIDGDRILEGAAATARARAVAERAVARAAAEVVRVAPEGYAALDPAALRRLPPEIARRLLQGVLGMAGETGPYGVRSEAMERLRIALGDPFAPRTLGGCRILPWRGAVLVCREPDGIAADRPIEGPGILRWDGRFSIACPAGLPAGCAVGALGGRRAPGLRLDHVPGPARPTLPAIHAGGRLVAVPTADWRACEDVPRVAAWFQPSRALAAGPFAVV